MKGYEKLYDLILHYQIRHLNFRAMKYFVKKRKFDKAAICRDRVGAYTKKGPA
jgi:hypothetical protein